jgi:hypothetical protein
MLAWINRCLVFIGQHFLPIVNRKSYSCSVHATVIYLQDTHAISEHRKRITIISSVGNGEGRILINHILYALWAASKRSLNCTVSRHIFNIGTCRHKLRYKNFICITFRFLKVLTDNLNQVARIGFCN